MLSSALGDPGSDWSRAGHPGDGLAVVNCRHTLPLTTETGTGHEPGLHAKAFQSPLMLVDCSCCMGADSDKAGQQAVTVMHWRLKIEDNLGTPAPIHKATTCSLSLQL